MLRRAKFKIKKKFHPPPLSPPLIQREEKQFRLGQLFLFPLFKIQNFVSSENVRELEDTKVVFFIEKKSASHI